MYKVDWKIAENVPTFQEGKLYLFRIDLTSGFEASDVLFASYLTAYEVERCNKFRFHKDRIRFSVGRYMVRRLLRRYVRNSNSIIEFQFNEYGKPNVDHLCDTKFNISHSGKYLLIGMGGKYEVGVDTEVYNATIDHLDLAKSVFSVEEQSTLANLSNSQRIHGFYRCWSMKESFIKSIGLGLQLPLDQFTVDLSVTNIVNHLKSVDWNPQLLQEFKTSTIYIDEGYSGAYTCRKSIDGICCFDLTRLLNNAN